MKGKATCWQKLSLGDEKRMREWRTETENGFDIGNDRFSYAVDRVAPRLSREEQVKWSSSARGIHAFPILQTNETIDELDAYDSDGDYC